jgi:ABC-2 type transport system ATP-binding protein
MGDAAIELMSVSKSYGNVLALDHVSFAVPQGQICGFLGPNGAGKTTTIRILFDLIRPSTGTARVVGIDCQREGVEARARLGYLPGDLRLYENQTTEQMLSLFAGLRGEPAVPRYARDLCDRLMLDPRQRLSSLSKGNKQKAGLVLALMHRPPVLVLDEPTSGLDPLVQEEVERVLFELADAGHTVFFSSHVLSEVERLCHRVVIIRGGRVVAEEDVADLKGRSLHIIEVTFTTHVPVDAFQMPGVEEIRRDGNVVHLQVQSNLDAALKAIARYPVLDIRTEQPSLEDVFLAFYKHRPASGAVSSEAIDV